MSRVAVLGRRPVARAPGLAALGRAGARRARAARPRVIAIDVGPDLVDAARRDRAPGRRVRRAARARRRGRHGAGDPRARRHPVHRVGPVGVHALHGQGAGQARAARRRPADARLLRLQPDRVRVAGRRARAAGDRGAARLPGRGQARGAGLGARASASRRPPPRCPAAIVAAFSYDTKVLLERHVAGRDLAVSVLDGRTGPRRCRSWRRSRAAATATTSRPATRSADRLRLPGRARRRRRRRRAQALALAAYRVLGCYGFARVDLMLDAGTGELRCSRPTRSRA